MIGPIADREGRTMTGARRAGGRALVVAVLVPVFACGLAGAAHAEITAVSGGATGVSADVTTSLGAAQLAATPVVGLPAAGSTTPVVGHAPAAAVPGVLSTGALDVSTQGALGPTGSMRSGAGVTDLVVGNGRVQALAAAAVGSSCSANEVGSTGDTAVVGLRVLGAPVAVSTAPNTRLALPVGVLHVNEQTRTGSGAANGITVTALRLELDVPGLGEGEVVVGRSECGVSGTGIVVPSGAVVGVLLTGLVAVLLGAAQIRRYRRAGPVRTGGR
jgi:hypothetical protein